jgi:NAD(P)H-flavin reductase
LASPYVDFVLQQTDEVLRRFPTADGFFFDIVLQGPCACAGCVVEVKEDSGTTMQRVCVDGPVFPAEQIFG